MQVTIVFKGTIKLQPAGIGPAGSFKVLSNRYKRIVDEYSQLRDAVGNI